MAKNIVYEAGDQIALAATDPTTPASGDPVIVGQLPGVALTAEGSDGLTTIKTNGVATLSVKGVDASANSAVAAGDILYYVTGDTPKLSKKNTGVRFGYALDAVASGATATIRVKIGY
jgi:predicted RecA/RadA family phage recombinase